MSLGMGWASARRSSCLPFQVFGVETFSFLPQGQSDRRDLARQGETGHRGPHPFGEQRGLEIDRKSTRLNSSHGYISYAVFCLKNTTELQSRLHLVCRLLLEKKKITH